jgi:hypothetical protein
MSVVAAGTYKPPCIPHCFVGARSQRVRARGRQVGCSHSPPSPAFSPHARSRVCAWASSPAAARRVHLCPWPSSRCTSHERRRLRRRSGGSGRRRRRLRFSQRPSLGRSQGGVGGRRPAGCRGRWTLVCYTRHRRRVSSGRGRPAGLWLSGRSCGGRPRHRCGSMHSCGVALAHSSVIAFAHRAAASLRLAVLTRSPRSSRPPRLRVSPVAVSLGLRSSRGSKRVEDQVGSLPCAPPPRRSTVLVRAWCQRHHGTVHHRTPPCPQCAAPTSEVHDDACVSATTQSAVQHHRRSDVLSSCCCAGGLHGSTSILPGLGCGGGTAIPWPWRKPQCRRTHSVRDVKSHRVIPAPVRVNSVQLNHQHHGQPWVSCCSRLSARPASCPAVPAPRHVTPQAVPAP